MATHGTIGEFEREREDWPAYCERLEQYFVANDVEDAGKQRAILLSVCGSTTYQLIRNLVAPAKPTERTFGELVKLVNEHLTPPPSVTMQRFKFHSRSQKEGETLSQFVAELRRLSEHCNFEASLDDMLRDRLVCGIRDVRVQRRLLAEPDLGFKKAFELAQAAEAADSDAKVLQKPGSTTVHAVQQQPAKNATKLPSKDCYRCGGKHLASACRFQDAECHYCHKRGHIARACRRKGRGQTSQRRGGKQSPSKTHQVSEEAADDATYTLFAVREGRAAEPIRVSVQVSGAKLDMELDTGASTSIISEDTYRRLWPMPEAPPLKPTTKKLCTYTREALDVKGTIAVAVCYEGQAAQLELVVVAGDGPSLFGRDWLSVIKLDWQSLRIHTMCSTTSLESILQKHTVIFDEGLGLVADAPAKIHVDPAAQPKFCKARSLPYALRAKVDEELERLQRAGIIEPIQFSEWAAPVVPVVKKDGSIRLCGDYKITVNQAARVDSYPLPKIDDLLSTLGGGQAFSKLDLAHAYQQVPLEAESKKFVVINTHRGLYQYNRLPFGVSAAPAIFQRTIEGILRGIPRVCIYLDDILITGATEREHLETLDTVLTRLQEAGLRLRREKCAFLLPDIQYLGHQISAEGLRPTDDKIRAVTEAPAPRNVSQLRSFLGLVNYYAKFLPQLSSTLAPLYRLLQKKCSWTWGAEQQKAFQEAKSQLTSSRLLVHYDPERELILSCDASPYGVGAVLSHRMDDGSEQPVAFASRSLAPAEKKYSQLDKEALSIIFGVKKFHDYLYGRHFAIQSDHKPLEHLFSASRSVPTMASARIQRWALTLSAYSYSIKYKPGEDHANADVFSRLPLPETPTHIPLPGETIWLLDTLQKTPLTASQIRQLTTQDPLLSRVHKMLLQGWGDSVEEELQPFHRCRDELSVQDGVVLRGSRVVIPESGRRQVLEVLHQGHPGTSRMKSLARGVVWWPGIDADLEGEVRACPECQVHSKSPPSAPLHPWEWPSRPWVRVHVDHAGPFLGKHFLVLVDAYSKWLEVIVVPSTSSHCTIDALRSIFATHGLPEVLVSDNGTAFTSEEFRKFLKLNGIRQVTISPYHPASNGLAERAVQTFKEGMKKSKTSDLQLRLTRFLFQYRITPHTTTGIAPAELLMGRRPRSHLDLLHPSVASKVLVKQEKQKSVHDRHATKVRTFVPGNNVFVRNFGRGTKWLAGVVTEVRGPLSYHVTLSDDRIVRRHVDHIRSRSTNPPEEEPPDDWLPDVPPPSMAPSSSSSQQDSELPVVRRSGRHRRPPLRFDPSVF